MGRSKGNKWRSSTLNQRIERTKAFKEFKAENYEKVKTQIKSDYPDCSPETLDNLAASGSMKAFRKTPEGKAAEKRLFWGTDESRGFLNWLRSAIFLRSNNFRTWCKQNNIPPWPRFLEIYSPRGVRTTRQEEMFGAFLSGSGKKALERWTAKMEESRRGVKNLMTSDIDERTNLPGLSPREQRIASSPPLRKALIAYDLSHFGFTPMEIIPLFMDQAVSVLSRTNKERFLMEITRLLFPQTRGQHPSYDAEASRCLQQVKRWIAKIERLIRLVDNP